MIDTAALRFLFIFETGFRYVAQTGVRLLAQAILLALEVHARATVPSSRIFGLMSIEESQM